MRRVTKHGASRWRVAHRAFRRRRRGPVAPYLYSLWGFCRGKGKGCRRTPHTARRALPSPCAAPAACPAPAARLRRALQRRLAAARGDPRLVPLKCRSLHRVRPRQVPSAARAMHPVLEVAWPARRSLAAPASTACELNAEAASRVRRACWQGHPLLHGLRRCSRRQSVQMQRRSVRRQHATEATAALPSTDLAASASHPTAAQGASLGRACRPNPSFNVLAGCASRPMTGRRCGSWQPSWTGSRSVGRP